MLAKLMLGVKDEEKFMLDELVSDYFAMVDDDVQTNDEEVQNPVYDDDNQIIDRLFDDGQDDNPDQHDVIQYIYDESAPNRFWQKKIGNQIIGYADDFVDLGITHDELKEEDDSYSYLVEFVPDPTEPDGSGLRKVIVIPF